MFAEDGICSTWQVCAERLGANCSQSYGAVFVAPGAAMFVWGVLTRLLMQAVL
jgi:hypothetical protein